ncbi:MAG: Rpn family recombination-promoting nuclease/putative transposase [Campylobacteraceae bacterium]|nr:Rpn family recombination-promoting nuclease/putative transposase [Campylobacteraceae bacterium]
MKFADPKNDLAFKKIFGDSNHKNILISFLNSVLDFKGLQTIVDVSLANPYQVPKILELKETILDIKATNKNGDNFIVEMQKKDLGDFTKRSLYYTSKAYISQLPKGNDYTVLKKVYFIGILNFKIFDNENFISRHLIINQETNQQDLDDFEFSFIELPKFKKELNELTSILDKWIYFIKNASDLSIIPEQYKDNEEFKDAFNIAIQTTWNTKELEIYDYMSLKEFDELNALKTAERKGIAQGIEKGIEQGIEKGIEQEKINIAQSLLDVLDNETIALKTGLNIEKIKELRS